MKILLTGATGFIGTKLGVELVHRGHELVVVTRGGPTALPFGCQVFEWDPAKRQIDPQALVGVEAVINLAGSPVVGSRWSESTKKQILESRVGGTETLLQALGSAGSHSVHTFINASAIGFYGDTGDAEVDESAPSGGDFLAGVCAQWESALANSSGKFRKAFIRIGIVLGANGGALAKMLPVFKRGLGGPLGNGNQWMSWIHVDDLVQIFVTALEDNSIAGPLNGVAPHPVTNKEFTKTLAHALKVPAFLPVPAIALRVALGESAIVVLASQKVSSQRLTGFSFQYPLLKEALHHILSLGQKD